MTPLRLLAILALSFLALTACGKEGATPDQLKDAAGQAKDAAGDLAAQSGELMDAVKNLSTDKIEALGKIAAKFENAPAEAEKMLEEHGWSKEEFDKMVKAIRSNEELNKVFEAAKKLASQH